MSYLYIIIKDINSYVFKKITDIKYTHACFLRVAKSFYANSVCVKLHIPSCIELEIAFDIIRT